MDLSNLAIKPAEGSFWTIVGSLVQVALQIAGVLAFIYLLYAGFQYITAGGDSGKSDLAKKNITSVVIGIIVILISYALVTFLTKDLVGGVKTSSSPSSSPSSSSKTTASSSTTTDTTSGSSSTTSDGTTATDDTTVVSPPVTTGEGNTQSDTNGTTSCDFPGDGNCQSDTN